LPLLLLRWLPDGRREGQEWVCRAPRQSSPGYIKIDLRTGCWADLATGIDGRDVITLAAYLLDLTQSEATTKISEMLRLASPDRS
jgi:hypothetical protein